MLGYSWSREDYLEQLVLKYNQKAMEEVLGCLGIGEQDTDYVLCNGDNDLLPTLYKKDEIRFTYNQYKNKRSYVSCTIFAAVGMASDLTNYEFSYDEIKEIDDSSYNNPDYVHIRLPGQGWYISDAVSHVRKRWNKNEKLVKKYGKLASYRVSKYSDEIMEDIIDKLYTMEGNMCPTTSYNEDKKDGMIDGTDFGKNTNGHAVDIVKKEGQRSVKDSGSVPYYGLKNKLSQISNFGSYFYVYTLVKEDNIEEIKRLNTIKSECLLVIEHLGNIYNNVNDKNLQKELHNMADKLRSKIKTCDNMLKDLV